METKEQFLEKGKMESARMAEQNTSTVKNANPPIPDGCKRIGEKSKNGSMLMQDWKGNFWVWCPTSDLPQKGIFNGKPSQFGRINFHENEQGFKRIVFSKEQYHEELTDELGKQYESVMKYGGFYVSAYLISRDNAEEMPLSIPDARPCNQITWYMAKEIASQVIESEQIKSHLIFGSEYDTICQWFLTSGAKTFWDVVKCSSTWGNYYDSIGSMCEITCTGFRPEYYVNGIADFAGNLYTYTQENFGTALKVIRGGAFNSFGSQQPVVYRTSMRAFNYNPSIGIRAALYIQ